MMNIVSERNPISISIGQRENRELRIKNIDAVASPLPGGRGSGFRNDVSVENLFGFVCKNFYSSKLYNYFFPVECDCIELNN